MVFRSFFSLSFGLFLSISGVFANETFTLQAYFILPDGSNGLLKDTSASLAVVFSNPNDNMILLDGFYMKGVEQLDESPRPLLQAGVIPCYLATIDIEFRDSSGKIIHSTTSMITSFGKIAPKSEFATVVQVDMPSVSGKFDVTISALNSTKMGSFMIDPMTSDETPRISRMVKASATLSGILIK